MLEKLRNSSKSNIPKIVLGTLMTLLILSFAIWGTEDLIGGSKKQTTVASVGKIDVSSKEFLSLYTRQTEEIRKLLGSSLDIKRGREFGYVDRALSSLINRALFNNQASDLGLSVSDLNVKDRIIRDDSFKDDLGQFSELIFRQLISESGYTEDRYVEGTRQDLARDQMVETLRSSFILPNIISKNIGSYNLEERSVNYFIIKSSEQPYGNFQDDEISSFYNNNKEEFKTEEFRDVETLLLDAKKFAENTTVTEEEITILYEERKESLIKPERRYLKQILVQDQTKSKKIYSELINGFDFSEVAKTLANLDDSDIDLGWNTKTELPEDIIDQVFSKKKGSITEPIKSSFGWHILKIIDVEEKKEFTFDDVKNKFRNELLIEKGKEAVYDLQDEIEDSLAAGESLKEISEKLEVKLIKAYKINKDGIDSEGKKNADYQDSRILRTVFNQKENEEGNLIDIDDDNGLAISIVKKIYPPKQMNEIIAKPMILEKLKKKKQYENALDLANRMKKEIDLGSIELVAKKYSFDLKGIAPFNRITPDDSEIPIVLIDKIFDAKLNEVLIHSRLENEIIVTQVEEIINAYGKDIEDMKSFNQRIEDDMSVDLLAQFSEVLRKKYKISINDNIIDQLN